MISFDHVTKTYPGPNGGRKVILRDANLTLPRGRSMAVLGSNGVGKSTLIRLIAGTEDPDRGRVVRDNIKVSWPLGFSGGFHGQLTGRENARFVARIYGCDVSEVEEFVSEFSELGSYLDMPVRTYSSGMRARFNFGVSMAVNFDVYLIDEITAVGDARFQERCASVFAERRRYADVIMVSHAYVTMRKFCSIGAILHNGRLTVFDDLEDAIKAYDQTLRKKV